MDLNYSIISTPGDARRHPIISGSDFYRYNRGLWRSDHTWACSIHDVTNQSFTGGRYYQLSTTLFNLEYQHYSQLSVIFSMSNPVILAINAGSSSIKYSVYEKTSSNSVSLFLNASISGLTAPPSQFTYSLYQSSETHKDQGNQGKEIESSKSGDIDVSNHEDAFKYFVEFLKNGKGRKHGKDTQGVIDLKRVTVVCHRIVHGGPEPRPLIITEEELHHLDELSDLAPLYIPFLFILLSHLSQSFPQIPFLRSFDPYYPEKSFLAWLLWVETDSDTTTRPSLSFEPVSLNSPESKISPSSTVVSICPWKNFDICILLIRRLRRVRESESMDFMA